MGGMGPPPVGVTASQLSRKEIVIAFSLVCSLFFTWGFAYGLVDVLNAHFQAIFKISKTRSTLLQFAYFGAYLFFSPFAGMFMNRYGYKKGIHLGLSLYSIGAIFFWPSAKFKAYGGFVASTAVMGCGLCTLEVAANSYIAVIGSPKYAAARLNFAQGFQGIASFAGPLIASRWFFRGENATKLDTVQWVYLAVAGFGLLLNILFHFCHLPEISGDALAAELEQQGLASDKQTSFWKQYRCIFGFVAQTCYVGAQVGVASFVVNYLSEQGIDVSKSRASELFSYCQMTFTAGRFFGVFILNFIDPALILSFWSVFCTLFCILVSQLQGWGGVGCLYALFFFESICYPCIFTLATKGLGKYTKKGSSLIVMGVGGGAWYPPAQGALADRVSSRKSYLVPMTGFIVMAIYAVGMVIDQATKGGFRFRNVEETDVKKATTVGEFNNPYSQATPPHSPAGNSSEEKVSREHREHS